MEKLNFILINCSFPCHSAKDSLGTAVMNYWLMKSEPDVYSLDLLQKDQRTEWSGVRNYQARNFMMKDMQIGDIVLFYHSNATPAGIAGLARVSRMAQPDPLQFNKKSEYYDPKATAEKPIWFCVEVEFIEKFKNYLSLDELRQKQTLNEMLLFRRGQRLSIQPVAPQHFQHICELGQQ